MSYGFSPERIASSSIFRSRAAASRESAPGTSSAAPARLREQYRFPRGNGEIVEAEEHIVLGHIGGHLTVLSST